MQECNPPRNGRLQTHQDDEPQGEAVQCFALGFGFEKITHRIDRFADALKTHVRLPRLLEAPAGESSRCCSGSGIKPALRRSLSR